MKRFLAIILAVILVIPFSAITAYASAASLSVTADKSVLERGDSVVFTVAISGDYTNLKTIQAYVKLSTTVFENIQCTAISATTIGSGEVNVTDGTASFYKEVSTAADGYTGSLTGSIFKVTATVKAAAPLGAASITFDETAGTGTLWNDKDYNNKTFTVSNTSVTVVGELTGATALSGSVTTPTKNGTDASALTGTNVTAAVTWNPALTDSKFAGNTVYTATITVYPATNYVFGTGASVTLSGYTFTKSDSNFVATKKFDKTADKETPTITTIPSATGITYGQTLADSTLSGGVASVEGAFAWQTSTTAPAVINSNITEYTVVFTPTDGTNYTTATCKVKLTVGPKTIAPTIAAIADQTYTGSEKKPAVTVTGDGKTLVKDTDYTVGYSNNTNAGTATVTVTAASGSNYTWATPVAKDFTITKATGTISISGSLSKTYNGEAVDPAAITADKNGTGAVSYKYYTNAACTAGETSTAPTDAGSYWVEATMAADDNYSAATSKPLAFTISKAAPTYVVPATADIKVGSALSIFTAVAPASGTDAGGNTVAGTTTWYSNSIRTILAKESDVSSLTVGKTKALYWSFVPTSANYSTVTGQTVFTIVEGAPQTLTFGTPDSVPKIYGASAFTNAATNDVTGGGTISYKSSNTAVATVDDTGKVTIIKAGTAVITANVTAVPGTYAAGSKSYTLTVNKRPITVTVTPVGRAFGEANPAFAATVTDGTLVIPDVVDDLGLGLKTAATTASNAGKYDVVGDGSYNANYDVTIVGTEKFTITKANATAIPAQAISYKYTLTGAQTYAFPSGLPANKGTTTYSIGGISNPNGVLTGTPSVDSTTGTVSYTLAGQTSYVPAYKATFTVTATMQNYNDVTVSYIITLKDKDVPTVTANDLTVTYDGNPVAAGKITGSAKFGTITVAGAWSWKADPAQALTNVADSGSKTVVFTPTDGDNYAAVEKTLTLTINKANVTGAPTFTKITATGKTLADAALEIGTLTPAGGTLSWDDPNTTVVTANTAYKWTYTPTDTANYNVKTGSLTPYSVYTGSSSGYGTSDANLFWQDVQRQIKAAEKGSTIVVNAKNYDQMPWYVMRDLKNSEVGMTITWNGGREIYIPAGKALADEAGRIYFPLSYLETLFNAAPDANPETGRTVYTITAPETAAEPVITPTDNGLDLTMSGSEIETLLPEAPADTMPVVQQSRGVSAGLIVAIAAAAAALAAAAWVFLRKKKDA